MRLSGVIFRLLSKVFSEKSNFFVGELVEPCTSCGSAGDGFSDAVAALGRVVQSSWCIPAMYDDVLAFGTVLCVPVCVEVVLTYVESADGRGFVRRFDSFGRLMLDGFMSDRCM